MPELSLRLELQQLPRKCRTHRITSESRRRPYSETLQHAKCIDCGEYTLVPILPNAFKEAFLIAHGWQCVSGEWFLPEYATCGTFNLADAYDLSLELAK